MSIEKLPTNGSEWADFLGKRENYTRGADIQFIICEKINEVVDAVNKQQKDINTLFSRTAGMARIGGGFLGAGIYN